MDYKLILVCLMALCATPASGWSWDWSGREWFDSVPSDCPSEDPQTNVCGTLKEVNAICFKIGCCSDIESDEYEDDSRDYDTGSFCDWCLSIYTCSYYKCYERCCDGYERDMMGRCRNATGEIECEHGGSRMYGICLCPDGFEGKSCEIPVCGCMYGGECIVKDNRPYCNCSSDYYGPYCENAKCSLECQNGGTCYKHGDYEVCQCPEQFVGSRCELPAASSKLCPAPEYSNDFCETTSHCTDDEGCSGDEVCCYDGCRNMCQTPVRDQCKYGEMVFENGQTLKKDRCTNCICTRDDWSCYSQSCEDMMLCPDGRQPETKPWECCPSCSDELPSKPPIIYNCPVTTVNVNTTQFSNYGDVKSCRLDIYAVDGYGNKLEVEFLPERVYHPKSYIPTFKMVTAYAMDSNRNNASCRFDVDVKDIFNPVFTSCPADVYVFEDEKAWWEEPRYYDKVGVYRSDKTENGENGYVFQVGEHKITYTIQDYDRNIAQCSFRIIVTGRDTEFEDMPEGLRRRSMDNPAMRMTIIVAPIIGSIIIIAIILIALFCCRRKLRHKSETTGAQSATSRYDNNVYIVPCDVKDDVKDNVKDDVKDDVKLPAYPGYTLPENPPVYSKTGSLRGSDYQSEAPPSYHNPDYDCLH